MKHLTLLLVSLLFFNSNYAQKKEKKKKEISTEVVKQPLDYDFRLSAQTDLIAYTTLGGFSIWAVADYKLNRMSFAFVNFPNRYSKYYKETGLKENDRFIRLQLGRHLGRKKVSKYFLYGINLEYHWRELKEDGNPDEIIRDNNFKLGPYIGFEWFPWAKKKSATQNLSLVVWGGPNFKPGYDTFDRTFWNTGSVYSNSELVELAIGVNISYTFYKK